MENFQFLFDRLDRLEDKIKDEIRSLDTKLSSLSVEHQSFKEEVGKEVIKISSKQAMIWGSLVFLVTNVASYAFAMILK